VPVGRYYKNINIFLFLPRRPGFEPGSDRVGFSRICCHMPFQHRKLSASITTCTSEIRISATLLLLNLGYYKAWRWNWVRWNKDHIKFRESLSNCSKTETKNTQADSDTHRHISRFSSEHSVQWNTNQMLKKIRKPH
jgi:hypothetical protein